MLVQSLSSTSARFPFCKLPRLGLICKYFLPPTVAARSAQINISPTPRALRLKTPAGSGKHVCCGAPSGNQPKKTFHCLLLKWKYLLPVTPRDFTIKAQLCKKKTTTQQQKPPPFCTITSESLFTFICLGRVDIESSIEPSGSLISCCICCHGCPETNWAPQHEKCSIEQLKASNNYVNVLNLILCLNVESKVIIIIDTGTSFIPVHLASLSCMWKFWLFVLVH